MSAIPLNALLRELIRTKNGIIGLSILSILIIISLIAVITIPLDTFKEWHNEAYWIEYPRAAMPSWVDIFSSKKLPMHMILKPDIQEAREGNIKIVTHTFVFNYNADEPPRDFILKYKVRYTIAPLLQLSIVRPDNIDMEIARVALPSQNNEIFSSILFSTDDIIRKSVTNYLDKFNIESKDPVDIIFSNKDGTILKGNYKVILKVYLFDNNDQVIESKFILGGKVYGLFGTDELRRDLAIGILWGTPLALFIGVSVAVLSVIIGLIYGVISGYKGGNTDEFMMRVNDIIYALPALPILILLAVFIGKSILLMIGYLIIFSWVGIAKVSRSMALQIKNMPYIEASELIGLSNIKIIFKHIIPQLLPYTFASIAISVPGAIITEAGLSFLGLGDPTLPTWGKILHDANIYGASARGLWWWIIPPGVMIALTGLVFVLIGNALDSIINPRIRRG